ncbi:hypothetical protein ACS0TY_019435 [Phlomoides rotata]
MKNLQKAVFLAMLLILAAQLLEARLRSCNPSGKIRGITPPKGQCNQENDSDCCKAGELYTTYKVFSSRSWQHKSNQQLPGGWRWRRSIRM